MPKARRFLAIAFVGSATLVLLAFTLTTSGSASEVSNANGQSHTVVEPSLTLVQENGLKVLIPVGLPEVGVVVTAAALWRRRRCGRTGPGPVAIGSTVAIGIVSVLGLLTVGPFILPVAVLLAVACARSTRSEVVSPPADVVL